MDDTTLKLNRSIIDLANNLLLLCKKRSDSPKENVGVTCKVVDDFYTKGGEEILLLNITRIEDDGTVNKIALKFTKKEIYDIPTISIYALYEKQEDYSKYLKSLTSSDFNFEEYKHEVDDCLTTRILKDTELWDYILSTYNYAKHICQEIHIKNLKNDKIQNIDNVTKCLSKIKTEIKNL